MVLFYENTARPMHGPAVAFPPAPKPWRALRRLFHSQTVRILIVALGLLLAVQLGGVIADAVHAETAWLTLLCYAGPVPVAGAIFWVIGKLL